MPKPTKYVLMLKKALTTLGIKTKIEVPDGYKHIDITIPSARMNIEVDGEQHLTDPNQIVSDLSREHFSDQKGFETIHIQNKEIENNLPSIASALAEASSIRTEKIHRNI